MLAVRSLTALEAVPLDAQSLRAGVAVAIARPAIPDLEAVVSAVCLVGHGHASLYPLLTPHVWVKRGQQFLYAAYGQAQPRLMPSHEVVGVNDVVLH